MPDANGQFKGITIPDCAYTRRQEPATEPIQVGRSTSTEPGGRQLWTLLVTDQLVDACQDWSSPVSLRFERLEDGHIELLMRRV